MISTRNRGRNKVTCRRCGEIIFFNKDDIFDGEHEGERCVRCCECGKVTTLKNKRFN